MHINRTHVESIFMLTKTTTSCWTKDIHSGNIYFWIGKICVKSLKMHQQNFASILPAERKTRLIFSVYMQTQSIHMYSTEVTKYSQHRPFLIAVTRKNHQVASQGSTKFYFLSQLGAKSCFLVRLKAFTFSRTVLTLFSSAAICLLDIRTLHSFLGFGSILFRSFSFRCFSRRL